MIGVVGSEDSVRHVERVASETRLTEGLVTRGYRRPEEAPAFASEIDPVCSVILFTGRVPHALAHARANLTASTDYVPHSGVDLFRALVMIARDFHGGLPKVSIDTVERAIVTENFEEIGETPPEHLFALDPLLTEGASGTEAISDFHARLHAAGEVELCMTCLSSVRDALQARGVPVHRIAHTNGAVRDSLQRASLTSQVQRLEASQVAVVTVAWQASDGVDGTEPAAVVRELAALVGARQVEGIEPQPNLETTRGALERELGRGAGALPRAVERLAALPAWLAVGYGESLAHAAEQSRYARTVAAATRDHHVVLPDGTARRLLDGAATGMSVRDTDPGLQASAQLGGIGPMTLARLQAALAALGRSELTAKELSRAYGVEPRSARRLLNALAKAGLAEPLGAQSAPRAGRPQVIYRVNLDALLRVDASARDARAEEFPNPS